MYGKKTFKDVVRGFEEKKLLQDMNTDDIERMEFILDDPEKMATIFELANQLRAVSKIYTESDEGKQKTRSQQQWPMRWVSAARTGHGTLSAMAWRSSQAGYRLSPALWAKWVRTSS